MARYGLDAAVAAARSTRASSTARSPASARPAPTASAPATTTPIQGMGGLMSVTGERDDLPGGGPQKVGVAVADLFTGMYADDRDPGGAAPSRRAPAQGQAIDMALLDTQVAMLANLGANYLATGVAPGRAGNAHQNIVPVPGVRGRRRPPDPGGRQRRPVRPLLRGRRLPRAGRATRASPATPTACATAATLVPLLAGVAEARAAGRLAGGAGGGQGAVRRRSTTWPRCSPTRRCSARGMTVDDGASARRRAAAGRQPDEAVGDAGALPTGRRRCWAPTPTRSWPSSASTTTAIAALRRAGAL